MKRLILLGLLVMVGLFFVKDYPKNQTKEALKKSVGTEVNTSPSLAPFSEIKSNSVFVPYWHMSGKIPSTYDKVIYFGIAGGKEGIIEDVGYQNIFYFQKMVNSSQKQYLTLRLLDTDTNLVLLENRNLQQKIISKTNEIAQKYEFDGIVIDLELSVLPLDDTQGKINDFISYANGEFQRNNLKTAVVLYGDAFYRARPFDVKFIGQHSDEIMVMAYDFSKSYGEPGPNFPLRGKETYGYDLESMVNDYVKVVAIDKLTVIFGMYGWNWPIGPEGKPLTRATAMSLSDINTSFINGCSFSGCSVIEDAVSAETKVTYQDSEGKPHVVWFENEDSVSKKKNFLQEHGIGSIGKWVWGYF